MALFKMAIGLMRFGSDRRGKIQDGTETSTDPKALTTRPLRRDPRLGYFHVVGLLVSKSA